ncbi:MAG: hypothetical protein ABI321_06520 [Polyangia bacterium]
MAALLCCSTAWAGPDDDMGRRLQQLLRAHQADVFACVAKQPEPASGEALLRIVVGGDHVPEVLKADAAVQRTAECVALAARSWDLSSLGASVGDQVVFPLAFAPEKPGAGNVALFATMRLEKLAPGQTLDLGADRSTALLVVSGKLDGLAPGTLLYSVGKAASLAARRATVILHIDAPSRGGSTTTRVRLGAHATRMLVEGDAFDVRELCLRKGDAVTAPAGHEDTLLYVEHGRATVTLGSDRAESRAGDVLTVPRGTSRTIAVTRDLCLLEAETHVRPVTSAPAGP